MTRVRSSSSQNWRRSLEEMSALAPSETKLATPSPISSAKASTARPRVPDWLEMARTPLGQGGEARRQAHPGVGVDEAQGARAQKAHPQPPRLVRQGLGLLRGEARGEDDGPPRSPAPRGLEGLRDPLLGHGHHHEVHGPGDALQAGVGEEGPHGPPSLPMASFTGKTGPWKRPKMRFSRTR